MGSDGLVAVPHGDCEQCCGPVWPFSDLQIDLAKLAYWVWMRMPNWLAFGKIGFAVLPWAGMHAYSCTCRDKNRRAREAILRPVTPE